jgi:IS1 family transposase
MAKTVKVNSVSVAWNVVDTGQKPAIGNMRIDLDKAAFALNLLVEGMSIRACERLTGLNRDTLCDLILVVGENCQRFMDSTIRNVPVEDVQVDELWSFIGCKEKNRKMRGHSEECGDSWTFIAIERNTKLILAPHVACRDGIATRDFLAQLKNAVTGRFQLTTDGFAAYESGVPMTFFNDVDFAQLIKRYRATQEETRYSPATIIRADKVVRFGNPDVNKVCTSHIERLNLTCRMQCRRITRLTNAHSKSLAHHVAMQAILVAYYNFCRRHETIKTTPTVKSGLATKALTLKELLIGAAE